MDSFAVLTKSTPSERKRESFADLFEADFPGGRQGFSWVWEKWMRSEH